MHNYQKAEKKWSDRYERAQLFVLYIRQNKLKVFLFLVTSITTIGITVYLITEYLESMCSKVLRVDFYRASFSVFQDLQVDWKFCF